FFFQAEDGIRSLTVTGVQTCALPISRRDPVGDPDEPIPETLRVADRRGPPDEDEERGLEGVLDVMVVAERRTTRPQHARSVADRSEERRVGKEWRSRWRWDVLKECRG